MWDQLTRRLLRTIVFDEELPDVSSERIDRLPEILRANRVPLAVLPAAAALAADAPAIDGLLKDHREQYYSQLCAYSQVAEAWSQAGVDAVLIKSPGYFPYTSSNLDVLVHPDIHADAAAVLAQLGYAEVPIAREPHKLLFRRLVAPHLGFPIHLHTAVAWINRFLDADHVLSNRRASPGCPPIVYPSPENVLLITTAHWLFEDKQLSLRDILHVYQSLRDGADWAVAGETASASGWGAAFRVAVNLYAEAARILDFAPLAAAFPAPTPVPRHLRAIVRQADGAQTLPLRIPRWTTKGVQIAKSIRDPSLPPLARVADAVRVVGYAARAKLPSIRNGPFVPVALSGPDGSGKTTLARALQEFLEREVGVGASYEWIRVGTSPALDALRRAIRIAAPRARSRAGGGSPSGDTGRGAQALEQAWTYAVFADALSRLWLRRLRLRAKGGIHIFDRDAIDTAVDLQAMYGFRHAWLAPALAPSPAVQIILGPGRDGRDAGSAVAGPGTYERYFGSADHIIAERDDLGLLVHRVAQIVLASYVGG